MTEFRRVCAAIDEHNERLIAAMDDPDFDPGTALDCTLNGGQYKLTDFFDVLKGIPYGETPTEMADPMLESTDRLLAKILSCYGDLGSVREKALAAAHAFRRSKRLWRIRKPYASVAPERYAQLLDDERDKILAALDDLNVALAMSTAFSHKTPNASRQSPASPRAYKRRAVSFAQAARLLDAACAAADLGDRKVNARTFQRWERGETEPKANYTAKCRDSLAAFTAWMKCYIAEEKSRLRSARAVAYLDAWGKHAPQGGGLEAAGRIQDAD